MTVRTRARVCTLGTQADMIRAVREKTGMFLDTSYLNKIYKGQKHSKKIIEAIREVLDLPTE